MYGREKAVRFGTNAALVGIVTEPAAGTDTDGKPAFVLLNSGILHRVGSCRLHVRLARALSAQGFTCLRFDYSGIGDSDQRKDALSFEESSVIETREALDYLAKTKGTQKFVLMGLCSGADMAHETALVDARVVGVMQLDAWVYRTVKHYVTHYGPRVFRASAWKNFVGNRVRMLFGASKPDEPRSESEGVEYDVPKYVRIFPPRKKVEAELSMLVRRGVEFYCVWTGGLVEYNYHGQFADAFRSVKFGNTLREDYLKGASHILTGLHHQEYVVNNVVSWSSRFSGPPRVRAREAQVA